jgi:hypothetical protein
VIDQKELSYLRKRLVQERDLARSAACEEARAAHAALSSLYEARLAMGHLGRANARRLMPSVGASSFNQQAI